MRKEYEKRSYVQVPIGFWWSLTAMGIHFSKTIVCPHDEYGGVGLGSACKYLVNRDQNSFRGMIPPKFLSAAG